MKTSIYSVGLIFLATGLSIKIPAFFYLQIDYLFEIGFGFSVIGIILVGMAIIKNRRDME